MMAILRIAEFKTEPFSCFLACPFFYLLSPTKIGSMTRLGQQLANVLHLLVLMQLLADGFADEQTPLAWSNERIDLVG